MELQKKKLFNEHGDRDWGKRRMIGGNTTNLIELNNVKYEWATKMYRNMMNNFWIPEEIPLCPGCEGLQKPVALRAQQL